MEQTVDQVRQTSRQRHTDSARPIHDTDFLAREEPLEIRVGAFVVAVLMRTPGHDEDLARGYALTERIFKDPKDLLSVHHCSESEQENVMILLPRADAPVNFKRTASVPLTHSSCGICGKRSVSDALVEATPLKTELTFPAALLKRAPELLRQHQHAFQRTGGLHGAGLLGPDGVIRKVREDIGRHNAVDKTVGAAAADGVALEQCALILSGRGSYEMVQKALAVRISMLVCVGGVSSLAADLAKRAGLTLIGFASATKLSVYSHTQRVT